MSILIKGMKMPQNCLLCPFGNEFGECCVNTALEDANELTHSCLLIELPDHGDLIDRDAVKPKDCYGCPYNGGCYAHDLLNDSPVVIPAERSEDGKYKI